MQDDIVPNQGEHQGPADQFVEEKTQTASEQQAGPIHRTSHAYIAGSQGCGPAVRGAGQLSSASQSQRSLYVRRGSARSILEWSTTLPERAPSRERLGVGYGSQLDLVLSLPEAQCDGERVVPDPGSIQARLDYAEHMHRRRATSMLCLGAVFGMLGFLVAATLGMWRTYHGVGHDLNLEGITFPSGQAYWPSSVSEMVNDPKTPAGKCWMCFEVTAAVSIWLSWYPWELRNVYVGGHLKILNIPFLHLRTFVPPVGLLMVVFIPMSTSGDFADSFATCIHLTGAILMLGGHGLFEVYTLSCAEFVHISRKERQLRWISCICCLLAGLGFLVSGHIQLFSSNASLCCDDVWRIPTQQDVDAARANGYPGLALKNEIAMESSSVRLYDTASETVLFLKNFRYWCEVAAGVSMICGLITIWYFCPERRLELGNELPGKFDHEGEYDQEGDNATNIAGTFLVMSRHSNDRDNSPPGSISI